MRSAFQCALVTTVLLHSTVAVADEAVTPSAVKILLSMKKVYAGCRSYQDSGKVTTTGILEGGQFGSELAFTTAFVRPAPFRFEFSGEGLGLGGGTSRFIAWTDGAEVRVWWQGGPRRAASLQEALDAAAGISSEASLRIPGMLLPSTVGSGPPLVDPERMEDDVDRGVPCFVIRGKTRATPYSITSGTVSTTVEDESVTLWIDRASFLLRKIEHRRTLSTYRSVTTTILSPGLDGDIPPSELAFAPPAPEPASAS